MKLRWITLVLAAITIIFALILWLLPDKKLAIIVILISVSTALIYLFRIRRQVVTKEMHPSRIALAFSWMVFLGIPFIFLIVMLSLHSFTMGSLYWLVALTGLTLTLTYDLIHLPLALYHKYKESRYRAVPSRLMAVSFIVPAFNEEKDIARTLESLLEVNYPNKEIVVVNDGSSDRTEEIARSYESKGVKIINQPNRGKAVAINAGVVFAGGEIIITVDADSLVERDALYSIIGRFEDPTVMAVCGNVKVLNRVNTLTRCQALEYITDINLAKRAFDLFGSTMVVPGVFGAFRKSIIDAGGRYDPDTVTEDFDITIKSLKAGGVVQATIFSSSYTEAPENLRDLYKQRLRWYRGTFQVVLKHRDVLANPLFGLLSELGFPYIVLSMVIVPIVGIGVIFAGVLAALSGYWLGVLILFFLYALLEIFLSMFTILLDEEDLRLLIYAPFFVIGYRQWRDLVKLKALFDVLILRKKFEWGRVRRLGRAEEIRNKSKKKEGGRLID